ncbi:MAG: RNA polymerase sigma factor [Planctomycetota bacterium]|jgi:RNA polymerase sigma-70 factor (ECF subfamily)
MIQETDRNLMDAYCRGEDGAFETLVRRHGAAVLGYLVKMTQNKDHAEDLFQETFQKVHENAEKFTGVGRWRKEKKHAAVSLAAPAGCPDGEHCPTLESTLEADTPEPVEQVALNEKRKQVRAALETLPTQQRAALILNYYHQMTYKQIAESLDCSVGSVRTHLFRALKKMAAVLPNPAGGVE